MKPLAIRINLGDQSSLIHLEMPSSTAQEVQKRGVALFAAFFIKVDALCADERDTRKVSGSAAIEH